MPTRRGVGILPRPGPLDAPVKLETPATPPTQTTRPPGMQEDTPQSPGRSGLRASTVSHAGTPARAGNRLLAEPFLSPPKSPSPVKRQAPSKDEEDFSPASSEAESSSDGEWSRGSNSGRRGAAKRRCRGPGASRVAVKLEQEDGDDEWNDKEAKRASGSRICSWKDKNGAECGKSFSRNAELNRHMKIHLGQKDHVCLHAGCGKLFVQKAALEVHKRIHNGEKPYKCDRCDARFVDSSSRRRHERSHDKQTAYNCHVCTRGFTRRATLGKHLQREHGTELSSRHSLKSVIVHSKPSTAGSSSNSTAVQTPVLRAMQARRVPSIANLSERADTPQSDTTAVFAPRIVKASPKCQALANESTSAQHGADPEGSDSDWSDAETDVEMFPKIAKHVDPFSTPKNTHLKRFDTPTTAREEFDSLIHSGHLAAERFLTLQLSPIAMPSAGYKEHPKLEPSLLPPHAPIIVRRTPSPGPMSAAGNSTLTLCDDSTEEVNYFLTLDEADRAGEFGDDIFASEIWALARNGGPRSVHASPVRQSELWGGLGRTYAFRSPARRAAFSLN